MAEVTPRARKMRAVQKLFHDNTIVEEGEVFVYYGSDAPPEDVMVPVLDESPVGSVQEPPAADSKNPPPWTTKGYVDQANRSAGERGGSAADDLLL